jgi:protein-S-isoprenylcysteine O-methyltransferase Ste14
LLGISRVLFLVALAVANRDTVPGDPTLLQVLAIILLIPAVHLFYSVARYFGFRRAFGIDHFDPRYRAVPLVRRGIFEYSPNGMYVFGFLLLWSVALWYASVAALIAALFNHLYIWVHYWATERPDMRRIYGARANGAVR